MKKVKTKIIIISIFIVLIFGTWVLISFLGTGLPGYMIVTSDNPTEKDVYFYKGEKVGTWRGFCLKHKDMQDRQIVLVREDKIQMIDKNDTLLSPIIIPYDFHKLKPKGSNLGLEILDPHQANLGENETLVKSGSLKWWKDNQLYQCYY